MADNKDSSPDSPIAVLSAADSWDLLGTQALGRVVVSISGRMDIFPVNFVTHDRKVLFRTAAGTKLVELTIQNEVVFEADNVSAGSAWSVVVHGTARQLQTSSDLAAAEALDLHSWLPTLKDQYVEITATEITGRVITIGEEPERDVGRY